MRALNGIHAWNEGFSEGWTDAVAIGSGGIVMLDMLLPFWYPELRSRRGPEYLFCVRLYPEAGNEHWQGKRWNEVLPAAWAAECARRLLAVPGVVDDPFVCISPANEQDLAIEGHPGGARDGQNYVLPDVFGEIWTWQLLWTLEMRRLLPNAKLQYGTAPLAGGHEPPGSQPDSEYQLGTFRQLTTVVDCLWDHAYCPSNGLGSTPSDDGYWYGIRSLRPKGFDNPDDPGGLASQYPHKTIIRSEFGNFRHHDAAFVQDTLRQFNNVYHACWQSKRYTLIAPFIWNSGDEHQQNRIRTNPNLVATLKAMQPYPAAGWPPKEDNMGLRDQYPNEFKAWEAAGGVDHHFKAHLLGTGTLKPTAADLRMLAGNAKATASQIEAVVNALHPLG